MRVNFTDLAGTLKKVANTLPAKDGIAVLTNLCFRGGKVTSFNGRTGTITPHGLNTEQAFCVDGKKFLAVVTALVGEEGTITFADGWVFVRAGQFSTKLPFVDASDYPEFKFTGREPVLAESPDWVDAVKACLVFASMDESVEAIMGVGLDGGYAYSTDRKRIVRGKLGSVVTERATLTPQAATQVVRLGNPMLVRHSHSTLWLDYDDGTTVIALKSNSGFPFEHVAPAFDLLGLEASVPDGLREAVDRVSAFSEDEEGCLLITSTGSHMTLETAQAERGSAQDAIPFTGPQFSLKVKAHPLKTLLKQLKPTRMDLKDMVSGNKQFVAFGGEGWDALVAGML